MEKLRDKVHGADAADSLLSNVHVQSAAAHLLELDNEGDVNRLIVRFLKT